MAKKQFCSLDLNVGEWVFEVPENYTIGDAPKEKNDTKLHQILQSNVDKKYYLSQKACEGILRRAKQRGKELPEVLEKALKNQAAEKEKESYGVVSKGNGTTFLMEEKHPSLTTGGGMAGQGYPCALCAGFRPEPSAEAGSISYKEEQSPTITLSGAPAVMSCEFLAAMVQNQREEVRDVGDKAVALNAEKGTHQQNFLTFRKKSHAKNKEDGQGWQETETNDTLNVFDNGEKRTPTLIADKNGCGDDIAATILDSYGTKWNGNAEAYNGENFVLCFEPGAMSRLGGHYYEDICTTLRAHMGDNQICVLTNSKCPIIEQLYAFSWQNSKSASLSISEKIAPSIRANNIPSVSTKVIENHAADSRFKIKEDNIVQTLPAAMGMGGNNEPMVLESYAIDQQGGKGNSNYCINKCPTLMANSHGTPHAVCYPMFLDYVHSLTTGSFMRWEKEKASTLAARDFKDPQVVIYGISSYDSNAMKSENPKSGIYEADTTRTLDLNGGNPACNQGGMAVVEGNGSRPSHKGDGYKEDEIMYTLNATEQHAVAFSEKAATLSAIEGPKGPSSQQLKNPTENFVAEGYGKSSFGEYQKREVGETLKASGGDFNGGETLLVENQVDDFIKENNKNAKHQQDLLQGTDGVSRTIAAGTHDSAPHLLKTLISKENKYYIRRLTPTECARLQNFPDWWCKDLGEDNPSQEEIEKWKEIFETHRKVITQGKKSKTDKQIIKFLKNPHTDGKEYKMWGNGIALPCAWFVMEGISWANKEENK